MSTQQGPPSQTGYTEITPGNWVYTGGTGANVPYSSTLSGIEASNAGLTQQQIAQKYGFFSPQQVQQNLANAQRLAQGGAQGTPWPLGQLGGPGFQPTQGQMPAPPQGWTLGQIYPGAVTQGPQGQPMATPQSFGAFMPNPPQQSPLASVARGQYAANMAGAAGTPTAAAPASMLQSRLATPNAAPGNLASDPNYQSAMQAMMGGQPRVAQAPGGIAPSDYQSAMQAMMGGQPNTTSPAAQALQTPTTPGGIQTPAGTTQVGNLPSPYTPPTQAATPDQGTNWQGGYIPGMQGYIPSFASTGGPNLPMVPNQFDPAFLNQYGRTTGNVLNQIGAAYAGAPWGSMGAAQMNTGQVPQVNAAQAGSFPALQFLLSGQGYSPQTLATMRAQATDANAQAQMGTMSAARQAAERAGLLNSGMGIGLQANVANQSGQQLQQALNQIAIQNAQQGIQNLQTGAGMQLNLGESNAAQYNQVALQNAANLFSSMSQNLANQQATNAANFAGQQQRALGQAQSQAGYAGTAGGNLQSAMANQYYNANLANANLAQNQWQTSTGQLAGLAGERAPYTSGTPAAAATSGTSAIGTGLGGFGTGATKPTTATGG